MGESANTTTRIAAEGEIAAIYFLEMSPASPRFSVAYVESAGGGVDLPAEVKQLRASLGQKTLELEANATELAALRQRVAELELGGRAVDGAGIRIEPAEVAPRADGIGAADHREPSPSENPGAVPTTLPEQRPAPRPTEIDINPTPGLPVPSQRCEQIILYMLQQPALAVTGRDAGGTIRQGVGIERVSNWGNTRTKLVNLGILSAEKTHAGVRRSKEMRLDLEALLRHAAKPFVTPKVLGLLRELGQASTFDQPAEQYKEYLQRLVNRGESVESPVTLKQIDALLAQSVKAGYTQNGGLRHRLTVAALTVLIQDAKSAQETAAAATGQSAANDEVEQLSPTSPNLIAPQGLPLEPVFTGRAYLDTTVHEFNQMKARSVGHRAAEILAELELADGVINDANVALLIRQRVADGAEASTYGKAIEALSGNGYVDMRVNDEEQELRLTAQGIGLIALMKTYSHYMRQESKRKLSNDTTFHIIELIIFEMRIANEVLEEDDQLPDYSKWLVADEYSGSLVPLLMTDLGKAEDTILRRLYSMREEKKYIEADIDQDKDGTYRRIRLTKAGMELARYTYQELRQKEAVLDDEAVEEVQEMVEACSRFAQELGNSDLAESLGRRYDERHLFEMGEDEFLEEQTEVAALYRRLKGAYIRMAAAVS
ncbi:MAG TPA: hypothetical protein VK712_03080 [Verrucomicrobiae bacterium]|nr:hypothetical protein [Verrucomicrobiae bacterium]